MCFNPSAQEFFIFLFGFFSFFRLVLGILICNFHNFTGRTQTHTRTHTLAQFDFHFGFLRSTKHSKNSLVTYYEYFALVQFLKNSRATSTADDAHLSCGCGATVARGSRWRYTRWIAGLSMFDATCSRKTNRTGASFTFTHLKFE